MGIDRVTTGFRSRERHGVARSRSGSSYYVKREHARAAERRCSASSPVRLLPDLG